ncbi:MAG: hypothetical protein A2137_05050 [Chloroflexi bacterium RBG_16_58_8]|nr:MAG: hypothetical protein A2137_05050 [Chloroflexi bacterium RBG_16_58_8]
MKTIVPFREGLFESGAEQGVLLGSRCRQCGQVVFPGRPSCLNCLGEEIEPVRLGRRGRLYTYTIVHMPSEHFPQPYAIGWVELPEGVRVFSQLKGWQEQPLKTGLEMDLSFETLWEAEDKEVIGYVFRPVKGAKA